MAKSRDLRREVTIAKMQTLIDAVKIADRQELATEKTHLNRPASTTVVTLMPLNIDRRELTVHNNTNGVMYVKEGLNASSIDYDFKLKRGDHLVIDDYSGVVTGIFELNSGFAMVSETYYTT